MIDNCHYHNYQLIQINHRLQDSVHEMKRSPLNVVFNHEQSQVFYNLHCQFCNWKKSNKALIIVLKSEPTLSGSYQMVFERCFENNAKEQMMSRIFGNGGHCFWLQRLFNLLTKEQRAN